MQIRWIDVLRDALALVITSALVRAVAIGAADASDATTSALVLGFLSVGFCAAGCLSPRRRFRHLSLVAVATWLILALNGVLTGSAGSPADYVALLVNPTLLAMLVGGAASLAIVRRPAEPVGPASS